PSDLLSDFEAGFGADLSAVRLHRDDAAAQAVRDMGTRGFAAGRNVYLGRADLHSEGGRRLLGHELAHVLQQTGRPAPGGRVQASSPAGSAAPQREEPKATEDVVDDLAAKTDAFRSYRVYEGIEQDYKDKYKGDADLKDAYDKLDKDFFAKSQFP